MLQLALRFLFSTAAATLIVHAQWTPLDDAFREHDQARDGEYVQALKAFAASLRRADAAGRPYGTAVLWAYFGELLIEIGRLREAEHAIASAEPASDYWQAVTMRDRAALLLTRHQYSEAGREAENARREAADRQFYRLPTAYCASLEAEALLRSGNLAEAQRRIEQALRAVPEKDQIEPFFAPRILFTACVVRSYTRPRDADADCKRGIAMAEHMRLRTRDLALGKLALAEAQYNLGDFRGSRESVMKSLQVTRELFGAKHQDTVSALQLLALIDFREGRSAEACEQAKQAVQAAKVVFGDPSPAVSDVSERLRDIRCQYTAR